MLDLSTEGLVMVTRVEKQALTVENFLLLEQFYQQLESEIAALKAAGIQIQVDVEKFGQASEPVEEAAEQVNSELLLLSDQPCLQSQELEERVKNMECLSFPLLFEEADRDFFMSHSNPFSLVLKRSESSCSLPSMISEGTSESCFEPFTLPSPTSMSHYLTLPLENINDLVPVPPTGSKLKKTASQPYLPALASYSSRQRSGSSNSTISSPISTPIATNATNNSSSNISNRRTRTGYKRANKSAGPIICFTCHSEREQNGIWKTPSLEYLQDSLLYCRELIAMASKVIGHRHSAGCLESSPLSSSSSTAAASVASAPLPTVLNFNEPLLEEISVDDDGTAFAKWEGSRDDFKEDFILLARSAYLKRDSWKGDENEILPISGGGSCSGGGFKTTLQLINAFRSASSNHNNASVNMESLLLNACVVACKAGLIKLCSRCYGYYNMPSRKLLPGVNRLRPVRLWSQNKNS